MSRTRKHYAYGNGTPGCLWDHASGPYGTIAGAAAAAADALDLTDGECAELRRDGCLSLRWTPRALEVGTPYVAIFEVESDWTWE